MIRCSVEVVHGLGVLRKCQGDGMSVLVSGRLIRPAGGFSQLLALLCPHGSDQTAGFFLIRLGGAVRTDFACADVVDLVRFLDVRPVGCGQVIDGSYAVSCPVAPYLCGGSVDVAEEDCRAPRVGALPSASDVQDVDQRVVVLAFEPGGALVGSVAHEEPEGVIPRIVDSTALAYEEFGIPDAAVSGGCRREKHLELRGSHVLVLISPEESGLAVLGENRACGFRQCVQLHVSILSRRVCGETSGVLCLDPLFLLWRDCGAGRILADAVASSLRPMTGTRRAWVGRAFPATFVTVYGPGACRGPRVRYGWFSFFPAMFWLFAVAGLRCRFDSCRLRALLRARQSLFAVCGWGVLPVMVVMVYAYEFLSFPAGRVPGLHMSGLRSGLMLACAVRPPVLDDCYSSGTGRGAFPVTFVTLCGLGTCRGPRVRCGLSSGFVLCLIEEVA